MIARTDPPWHPDSWKKILASAIFDPIELLATLNLGSGTSAERVSSQAQQRFPLRVPRAFVARMKSGDAHDPLLRQVLPTAAETEQVPGFATDPVGEQPADRFFGLLHKYRGRALIMVGGTCAIHCRYCFRRHFPYQKPDWDRALARIAGDDSISEVILSGGDPLTVSDDQLAELSQRIAAIPHVSRLRIHSRMPVVLPERINDRLLQWLTASRLQPVLVIHANHPAEIAEPVRVALACLRTAGVTLLNQSVLLRGVNDSARTLAELSETLFDAGVLPYYLHLLDRVQGAAHFEVAEATARQQISELMARLPGYLVPRLVRETAGAASKLPLAPPGAISH